VLFLVFVVPRWLVPQNDVRIGLLQAVAGVAVIAAVVATWQQLDANRRQLQAQLARSRPPTGSPGPSTSWSASAWTSAWTASTGWSASPPWRRRR
jgi:hypothetical protein